MRKPARMRARYYGFSATGVEAIDRILSAVACAGQLHPHTGDWRNEAPTPSHLRGADPVSWIQHAAEDAAAAFQPPAPPDAEGIETLLAAYDAGHALGAPSLRQLVAHFAARVREHAEACIQVTDELAEAQEDYRRACGTIAAMHAAAVGEVTGPRLGVVEDVAALAARVRALEAGPALEMVYAPGHWRCAACGFYNVRASINADTGNIGVGSDAGVCPNDGALMQRVTWREIAHGQQEAAERRPNALIAAETRVRALEAGLREVTENLDDAAEHLADDEEAQAVIKSLASYARALLAPESPGTEG